MKARIIRYFLFSAIVTLVSSCDMNEFPETSRTDKEYWNTEVDFKYAANQLYALLSPNFVDTRGDDLFRNNYPDDISAGTRKVPAESGDWSNPFKVIFLANKIIENMPENALGSIDRYVAEARFFRAYNYHMLVRKYGDMVWIDKTPVNINDPILYQPRLPRETIIQHIYSDLNYAIDKLPSYSSMGDTEYGRISKSAAMALKARVALYEGTYLKFHSKGDPSEHLKIAYETAGLIMDSKEHKLFDVGANSYKALFEYEGEGTSNTENIFVKLYGTEENKQFTHNYPYTLCVNHGLTRNFLNLYLKSDGMPFIDEPETENTYNI